MAERDLFGRFVKEGEGVTRIELSEGARQVLADLQVMPDEMLKAIARAMKLENQLTVTHIHEAYLSFPKDEPAVEIGLRTQSNRLRRSVWASEPVIEGQEVRSAIGDFVTNRGINYAAVHEFGAHIERKGSVRLRTDAKGNLLRQGKNPHLAIFAHSGHKQAKEVKFESEGYSFDLPARGMFQRGIKDRLGNYANSISGAINDWWEHTA
jgi:hypothetical protein